MNSGRRSTPRKKNHENPEQAAQRREWNRQCERHLLDEETAHLPFFEQWWMTDEMRAEYEREQRLNTSGDET